MEKIKIKNKNYQIKEPTLKEWKKLLLLKEELDDKDLYTHMIHQMTGLSFDEILEMTADDVETLGAAVTKYFTEDNRKIYQEIEHKGVKYELVDVYKMTFGQFVDIDTFLSKDQEYRIANLHELAAYLYTEKGTKYSDSDFQKRIKEFEDLPAKYVDGAIFFLTSIGGALQQLTVIYSQSKLSRVIMKTTILLLNIGDGILRLVTWLGTGLKMLMKLLIYPLYLVLTILRISLTLIKKKKK